MTWDTDLRVQEAACNEVESTLVVTGSGTEAPLRRFDDLIL